jgi:ABC-2 type transport system ATP-binding protein
MIEFDNISKKFQNNFWEKEFHALQGVSFKIGKGDLVGFLGANGAGKTTLIKTLMDFSRQDSGQIIFDKILGSTPNEIKSNIGYLPERAYLYPYLTGREFLNLIASLHSIEIYKTKQLIEELSAKLQIAHALDRQIKGYSKGMQQRLGFVSAIIHNPKFIVLDEPLSGLDPLGRREFKKILQELNQTGTTIFFSSHVVADVEEICNKVVFIENGKLIYEGSIDSLIVKHSNDLYKIKYLLNEEVKIIHVQEKVKDETIQKILNEKLNILEIDKEKPTLEEIIYKIKT